MPFAGVSGRSHCTDLAPSIRIIAAMPGSSAVSDPPTPRIAERQFRRSASHV